jgi:hypothetical protein
MVAIGETFENIGFDPKATRSMTAGLRAISASFAVLRRRPFAVAQAVERRDRALENAGNLANVG